MWSNNVSIKMEIDFFTPVSSSEGLVALEVALRNSTGVVDNEYKMQSLQLVQFSSDLLHIFYHILKCG